MGYVTDAIKGFSWQTALKIATAVTTLLKISVLARLLTPDQFGVFSLVMIAFGLSEAATQTGVNITLLQSQEHPRYFVDTAWVIAIIRGAGIGVVMALMGYGLQWYFHKPELLPLVALAAAIPLVKGFINPAIISLRRELRFFHETIYQFSLAVVEAALAIALTFFLHSVVALILAMIGAGLFEVIISFLFFSLRPTFRYYRDRGKIILDNAKWLSASSVMGYLNENIDDFIVGSATNTYSLGLYHNAYGLSHKPNYDMADSVNHGILPIFTKIMGDRERLTAAYLKTQFTTLLLVICFSLPLILFPKLMVQIVLGNQWLAIVPLLPMLIIAGIVHSIALVGYTLFIATSNYKVLHAHQMVNLILMVSLMTTLAHSYGLGGAVAGLAIGRLAVLPIIIYGSYQTLKH